MTTQCICNCKLCLQNGLSSKTVGANPAVLKVCKCNCTHANNDPALAEIQVMYLVLERQTEPRINTHTFLFKKISKILFSEKSLSVPMSVCPSVHPSRPVPSQKKVTETENFTEQSCQMYLKGDKNTFRITLMPLQCWARQS